MIVFQLFFLGGLSSKLYTKDFKGDGNPNCIMLLKYFNWNRLNARIWIVHSDEDTLRIN